MQLITFSLILSLVHKSCIAVSVREEYQKKASPGVHIQAEQASGPQRSQTSGGENSVGPTARLGTAYWQIVEEGRRDKVANLEQEFANLQARVLNKDLKTLTKGEQNEISLFRMKLTHQIWDFKSKKAPYLNTLSARLTTLRDGLQKYTQYKEDEETYLKMKRRKGVEYVQRYRARQKAKKVGVNVSVKRGRKPLVDNAPRLIEIRRTNVNLCGQRRYAAKILERQQEGNKSLGSDQIPMHEELGESWGKKRRRSGFQDSAVSYPESE